MDAAREVLGVRPRQGRNGFSQRTALHDRELKFCMEALRRYGFASQRIGQETQPGTWQEIAQKLHGDPTARQLRFRPDVVATHEGLLIVLLLEVKSRVPTSPNIAIEKACHENALEERAKGIKLAYWFPANRMEWPENVPICRTIDDPRELARCKKRGGSGTPLILVRNEDITRSFDSFIVGEILWPSSDSE